MTAHLISQDRFQANQYHKRLIRSAVPTENTHIKSSSHFELWIILGKACSISLRVFHLLSSADDVQLGDSFYVSLCVLGKQ